MDNLNTEELKQLVVFYKNRYNEAEFTLIQNQFVLNRIATEKDSLQKNMSEVIVKNTNLSSINADLQSEIDKLKAKSKKKGS